MPAFRAHGHRLRDCQASILTLLFLGFFLLLPLLLEPGLSQQFVESGIGDLRLGSIRLVGRNAQTRFGGDGTTVEIARRDDALASILDQSLLIGILSVATLSQGGLRTTPLRRQPQPKAVPLPIVIHVMVLFGAPCLDALKQGRDLRVHLREGHSGP